MSSNVFRPIHYLGSKLRILEFIEQTIDIIDPNKGRVCDLFAGSGCVSFQLSKNRPVTAVDIQEYSRVICSSLLISEKIKLTFIDNFIDNCSNSLHTKNLTWAINPLVEYENYCINNSLINNTSEELCKILEYGSIISFEKENKATTNLLFKNIKEVLIRLNEKKISNRESIAIKYFGGIYFSYFQACQIDSILEEIENSPKEYRDRLISALLSTVSECVNTIGKQFAQPLRPRKSNGDIKPSLGKIVSKDRSLCIYDIFQKWIRKYNSIEPRPFTNQILRNDFIDALGSLRNDTTVIYADPPYTRDHYSRFYHVLETISIRDVPEISTMVLNGNTVLSRGLYRSNRYQSPFCIKSKAPIAFESLFCRASEIGSKLVLSYSPYDETKNSHPRVVTMNQLQLLARKYYNNIDIVSPGNFIHSKLNNTEKHLEATTFAEVLIICT